MLRYIGMRLVHSIFVLFGLSLLIFFIARVMPGDPARVALGPLATEEQVQKLRAEIHLDKPFPVQYYYWLKSLLRGNLGRSLYTKRPIVKDLYEYLPATLGLVLFSFIISLVIGQVTGVLAGYFRNSWFDGLSRLVSYIGVATPSFVMAIFFLLVFSQLLGFIPTVGRISIAMKPPPRVTGFLILDALIGGKFKVALNGLKHIILPALSLSVANMAQEGRVTRSSIVDNLQKDYVSAHVVHGIPTQSVIFKYLLKPSLIPTVSIMGLDFAFIIANAFLVELVFMWPGFARYAVTVMLNKDLNAIVAVVLVVGVAFAIVNLIVDIIVSFLDPRIRLQRRGG
jgi:peptide/nickel transport system permease protein